MQQHPFDSKKDNAFVAYKPKSKSKIDKAFVAYKPKRSPMQ
jgi:hypothetical protein